MFICSARKSNLTTSEVFAQNATINQIVSLRFDQFDLAQDGDKLRQELARSNTNTNTNSNSNTNTNTNTNTSANTNSQQHAKVCATSCRLSVAALRNQRVADHRRCWNYCSLGSC